MRFLALLFFIFPLVTNAQLWSEDFDGSNTTNPASWSSPSLPCGDNNDYLGIVCSPGTGCPIEVIPSFDPITGLPNPGMEYFGSTGQFFGARDMDSTPCGFNVTLDETLSFTGINIGSSPAPTVIYLCFDVAESQNNDPDGDGDFSDGAEWGSSNSREDTWDGDSFLHVDASVDGAPFARVTSIVNARDAIRTSSRSDVRPGIDVNCNGSSDDAGEPLLTNTFTSYCFELPTSGASLDLEFNVGGLNGGGEDIAIDNIQVHSGSTPAGGTLLDACTPFEASNPSCNDMVLWLENFDGSNTTNPPTLPACSATPSRDYLGIVCNNGDGCPNEINSDYLYFGASGQYFGVRDMDNVCGGSLDETLSFTGIDISACTGATNLMYLCLDMAESQPNNGREMTGSPPIEDSWDGSSSINFMVNIDGCGFEEVSAIESIDGTNSRPAIDLNCGGGSSTTDHLLSDNFQTFCFQLTNLGTTLDLNIQVLELNTDGEDIAIDNIQLICADDPTCLPSTPIVSCTLPEPLVIDCPADANIDCSASIDPANTGMATANGNCTAVVSFADVSTQGMGCSLGTYMITRTWTVTATGGATAACVQTINVTDTTPPVASCNDIAVVTDMTGTYTLTPADIAAIGAGTTDDCSGLDPLTTTVSPNMFTNANAGANIVTYTATDACGNASTCTATVTVTRGCMLDIDCSLVTDQTLECRADLPPVDFSLITAIDSCGPITLSALTIIPGNTGCTGDPIIINRTYFVQDSEGNQEECMQTFTIEDTTPPTITCPANATIQCDESIIPAASGSGTTTATSATNVLTWSDATSGFIGTVPVTPAGIPTGATVTDVNITLIGDHSWVGDLNLTLESPDGVMVNFLDNTTCPGSGNTDNYNVTFDDQAGAFNCTGVFSDTGTPDDCSNDYLNGAGVSGTMQPEQNNFAVFNGGTAAGAWILSVTDDAGGDGGCLISFSVDVSWELSGAGGTTGVATAVDNCAAPEDIAITFADVTDQTATGCGQHQYSITRTWTATDLCGNSSTCVQMITVEDTTAPVIACPADVNGTCTDSTLPTDTGMATATDNCSTGSDVVITSSDVSTQTVDGCGQFTFTITRTWTATDACGNASTCDQTISIADIEGPTVTCPPNQMLACDTDPLPIATSIDDFIAIGGTAVDNCSSLDELTISFSDFPSAQSMLDFCPGTPEADRTLTRTYTITDLCGNASTCQQLFIYGESLNGPVITATPADQTVDCAVNAFAQLGLFDAVGTCSSITTSVSGPSSNGTAGCPGSTIQYTYTATDVCGRTATHVQTYTLTNEGPEFVCPPDICVIDCPSDNDMIQQTFDDYAELATVITSCSETGVTIGNNFNPNNFTQQNCMNPTVAVSGAVAFQVVTFTATDVCGRISNCTALVVIRDTEGPVMTGSVSTGVANCDDTDIQQGYSDWANIQANNLEAMDECSGTATMVTYSPATPNTDCSSGLATTLVSFTATDACGNETTQTANYQIIDNGSGGPVMATVSGNLFTEENEMIALAEVEVEGFVNSQMTTNDDGYYLFDLMMAQNYSVTPSRNDDPLNGITTYDLVLLGQHLLEINSLDSPYKMIAADVNESGSITALDMIELRRLILMIDSEFSSGKSWTFVDAEYVFPNPSNPFATTYPTAANINNLTSSQIFDFIGIKLGDLNASANVNSLQSGDTRSSDGTLKIKMEDQQLKAGQTYDLAFKASDFKDVAGFQFTLDFAADYLDVLDFQSSDLNQMTAANFGFTNAAQGKIAVSWNENQEVNLADDASLFQFSFKALKDGQLSDLLAINSSMIATEAYQADLRKDVVLDFGNVIIANKAFTLLQNQPNPFNQETMIGFQLPEASEATLTIYDVSGRVIYTRTNTYTEGLHQVMLDKADLGATGVLYYQLSTSDFNATKKMIVLK